MTGALPQPTEGSDWTIETLRQHIVALTAAQDRLLAEMDRRYQQRFESQNEATLAALTAQADRVALALATSDRAVAKAETATEKRFESVNEFRAQLTDQANTFIPRVEAEQRIAQNAEKIADIATSMQRLTARFDLGEGRSGGHTDSTRNLVTIIGIVLTLITVIVGIYLATKR